MENSLDFFKIKHLDTTCNAREGIIKTYHSEIITPIFMPVGTQATVKSLSPKELEECGCSIILSNTYHLHLRPGDDAIALAGGLHKFESWRKSILTDSGGFQVFSLKDISKISEEGVWFQSYIDGSKHFFSPERSIQIQRNLGADIIMMFDECLQTDANLTIIENAVNRTIRWAYRCVKAHREIPFKFDYPQYLFGIIQGGLDKSLRKYCVEELLELDLPGYAVGGLAVGETTEQMYEIAQYTCELLPKNKPRYLMGVGTPENILECIAMGFDMFDCVMPTRNARNGTVFSWNGKINIRNSRHANDFSQGIDSSCSCYACKNFSRGYLRHLFMAGEILGIRLLTLHNIYFYMDLIKKSQEHIIKGDFINFKKQTLEGFSKEKNNNFEQETEYGHSE